MKPLIVTLLLVLTCAVAHGQEKGVDQQNARIRDSGNNRQPAVNGRKTDIPSAMVKANDRVAFTGSGAKSEYAKTVQETIKSKQPPPWLSLDMAALAGRVIGAPTIEGAESIFDPNVVVEYYSR